MFGPYFSDTVTSLLVTVIGNYTAIGNYNAVTADLYMEAFEEQTLATVPEPPRIWKRYVDDTFTVMKQHNGDNFLRHLNQKHSSIRFTVETENNNKIAFLDSLVTRETDGKLLTSVYKKLTQRRPVPLIWFTPSTISETRYCQVLTRSG